MSSEQQIVVVEGGKRKREMQEKCQRFIHEQVEKRPELLGMSVEQQIEVLTPLFRAECPVFVRMTQHDGQLTVDCSIAVGLEVQVVHRTDVAAA